jgi:hypothetical protein
MTIGERMLEVLDERGWCQGELTNDLGQVCLAGALRVAAFEDIMQGKPLPGAYSRFGCRLRGLVHSSIGTWNDAPERTEEDVRLLIKQADYELQQEADGA